MFEFSVSEGMRRKIIIKEVAVGKIAARLCLTLIIKELKVSVEHGTVLTTLGILFSGSFSLFGMTCLGNTRKKPYYRGVVFSSV